MTPEPSARGMLFVGARDAARKLWGPGGLDAIASRLPRAVRAATLERVVLATDWIPEVYMLEWYDAVWQGPASASAQEFRRWADARIDHGFGRVRSMLMKAVTPSMLLQRGPGLWRHDHTTGTLTTALFTGRGEVTLTDHPYTTTEVARLGIAEVFRYILSLARGPSNVREHHGLDASGALTVRLAWD